MWDILKSALCLGQLQIAGQGRGVSIWASCTSSVLSNKDTYIFYGSIRCHILEGRHLERTLPIRAACSKTKRLWGLVLRHQPESTLSENSTAQRPLCTEIPKKPQIHSLRECIWTTAIENTVASCWLLSQNYKEHQLRGKIFIFPSPFSFWSPFLCPDSERVTRWRVEGEKRSNVKVDIYFFNHSWVLIIG